MMFRQSDDVRCPVASLKKYLSKLNPKCSSFFQRPKNNISSDDDTWYENKSVGVHTINNFMKSISNDAGLSCEYTNHCLRATAATLLARAGIESRDICAVTGHKNESSLKSYVSAPTIEQRHNMSHIIHTYGKENQSVTDDALIHQSQAVAMLTPTGPNLSVNNSLSTESRVNGALFAGATFNGSTTINVNWNKI